MGRHDGTNPRSLGTNPRAQREAGGGAGPAASSPPGGPEAEPEGAPKISDGRKIVGPLIAMMLEDHKPGVDFAAESKRVLEAGFAQRGRPGEVLGEWMQRDIAEQKARGVQPPFWLGPERDSPAWKVVEEIQVRGDEKLSEIIESEKKLELAEDEAKFMKTVAEAQSMSSHDDDCAQRKGKECGCRDNLRALESKELKVLESKTTEWSTVVHHKKPKEPTIVRETAVLVRVDDGRTVSKTVPDPLSQTAKPITVTSREPPRWVCTACAASMRGTDIDHHCDDAVKNKAQRPIGLERTLPADVRFGGGYRLVLWRDRAGEYHLGEEVVAGNRVVEERHLYGPDAYNIIEGALLDAAVTKLAP